MHPLTQAAILLVGRIGRLHPRPRGFGLSNVRLVLLVVVLVLVLVVALVNRRNNR